MQLRELVLSTLVLIGSAEAGMYGKKSAVVNLDKKNFQKEILDSNHAAIVEFYAPWCGHCKNLKPAYEKVAEAMSGLANVAALDCDDDMNKSLCGEYDIKGFPTLKFFVPSTKKGKPRVIDYNGERSAKAISNGLSEKIPNHVTRVTADELDKFLSKKNETTKAILFTNKGTTPALWKALAIDFLGSISFATIKDTEAAAVGAFGVSDFPKVVLLPGGKSDSKVYDGKVDKKGLFDFFSAVKPVTDTTPEPEAPKKSSETKSPTESSEAPESTKKSKPSMLTMKTKDDLMAYCFKKSSKTCILTVAEIPETVDEGLSHLGGVMSAMAKIHSRPPPHAFQFFQVDINGPIGSEMRKKMGIEGKNLPIVAAVNHRQWYSLCQKDTSSADKLLSWMEDLMLGEAKKAKIPANLFYEIPEDFKMPEGFEMPNMPTGEETPPEEGPEEIEEINIADLGGEPEKKEEKIKDEL